VHGPPGGPLNPAMHRHCVIAVDMLDVVVELPGHAEHSTSACVLWYVPTVHAEQLVIKRPP